MKGNKTGLGVTGNTWEEYACHPDLSNIGTKIQRCVILTSGQRGVQGEDIAVNGSEWDLGWWSQPVSPIRHCPLAQHGDRLCLLPIRCPEEGASTMPVPQKWCPAVCSSVSVTPTLPIPAPRLPVGTAFTSCAAPRTSSSCQFNPGQAPRSLPDTQHSSPVL